MGRWMGLDLGTKRVGVALSDLLQMTAQPTQTLERRGIDADLLALDAIIRNSDVQGIVIGLPKNMDGSLGPKAQEAQEFAQRAKERWGLPTVLWDERLTTVAAERVLIDADLSRKRRKQVVDQMAAVLILQGFLDSPRKV